MGREVEATGATVEEAVESALQELGLTRADVQIEVVTEPKGGFLGVGSHEAVVKVRANSGASGSGPAPQQDEDLDEEELEDQADAVADFLDDLLGKMDVDAISEPNRHGGRIYVDIVDGQEEDMSMLIGKQGQTLEAIQELTRMAVGRKLDQRIRVIVDVEDYKKRRSTKLADRALEIAQQVAETGTEEELEPMNSFERKMVHDAVAGVTGVESTSRGEGPDRRVVIRPSRG